MLVSVIIPVYNVEEFLRCSLDSIINQTYEELEIIIVNDGSTDDSLSICKEYEKDDTRITVYSKENGGLMSAWLYGLSKAKGEYVYFIDSDDWVDNDNIEVMVKEVIKKPQIDMVVCNCIREYKNNSEFYPMYNYSSGIYEYDDIKNKIYPSIINNGNFQTRGIQVNRWGKLIRKEILDSNIKYCDKRISYGEDFNIMLPVFLDCKTLSFVENTYYHYRLNGGSILGAYNSKMLEQIEILYNILFQILTDMQCEFLKEQLLADYLSSMVLCVKNELKSTKKIYDISQVIKKIRNATYTLEALNKTDYSRYSLVNKSIISMISKPKRIEKLQLILFRKFFYLKMKKISY